jgi:hypothetical protein
MKILDTRHPFYAPLSRRIVICLFVLGWAVFEFVAGAPVWGFLFLGLGVYCSQALLWRFAPDRD